MDHQHHRVHAEMDSSSLEPVFDVIPGSSSSINTVISHGGHSIVFTSERPDALLLSFWGIKNGFMFVVTLILILMASIFAAALKYNRSNIEARILARRGKIRAKFVSGLSKFTIAAVIIGIEYCLMLAAMSMNFVRFFNNFHSF